MKKCKWKQLRSKQFTWYYLSIYIWSISLLVFLWLYKVIRENNLILGIIAVGTIGILLIAVTYIKKSKLMKISKLMEKFIRRNNMYQSHFITEQGIFGERKIERMDYYPVVEYREKARDNLFCIRIRMDGSLRSERFRELEQPLADMFHTVCIDKIEERGYLTYCFELNRQEQVKIQSCKDIPPLGENKIIFSRDISWNWKKCPHILLTGNTGSGKTQLAQYIISCLVKQGVRVIYCDPKNDNEMQYFIKNQCNAVYVSEERDIAKVVREAEEEMRKRGKELDSIGVKEADFPPLYLVFDELIAFSKTAEKRTYEETTKRIASIVVMGRSKHVYAGLILQRPDTSFIEGAIRDNLGCRICMGQMSDTAYTMAFGSDFADVKNLRREIGSGLIYRQRVDTKPREFLAPFIEKGALSRE